MPKLLTADMQLTQADNEKTFWQLYEKLNSAQKQAVDAIEGPVMVIAGPGTGKTQILALRIANLLRNPDLHLNPSNILCLTFTESAVTAMRNRLISIIGSEAYYVRIHTFHSFCNEIIKDNPHKFNAVSSISELEQIQIFNDLIDKLDADSPIKPFGDAYFYRSDLMRMIKTFKRESVSVEDLETSIQETENFISANEEFIRTFVERNARGLKDHDCEDFIEAISIKNLDSKFATLFKDFWLKNEKIADFKKEVKDFVETNLKQIPRQKELAKIYRAYQELLVARKFYDFEDMILRVIKQLSKDDELLARYQELFQYILVDEYQDTNGSQNKVLELMCSYYQENPNIFVVGDDDQSIFRFQGASIENIIYFYKRYESTIQLIVLDQNYRSQQNILDLAQLSINHNQSRIDKLVPSITKILSSDGFARELERVPLEIHKCLNEKDETYHLTKTIQNLIASGVEPREIAVLFKQNSEAQDLEEVFARLNVPFRVEAGENILENIHIAQLIDLLKVINNPESNSALLYSVLNYDFVFESKIFRENGITILDVFKINQERKFSTEKKSLIELLFINDKFKAFAEAVLKAKQESLNLRFDNFLEKLIKDFGYGEFIFKKPNYVFEINYLDSLFQEVKSLVESRSYNFDPLDKATLKQFTLEDFIKYIDLLQENSLKIKLQALDYDPNSVRLMTAHKSKGLEFDYVFVLSCVDKHWGNKAQRENLKNPPFLIKETQSHTGDDRNEEERRLFYVALTRARKKVSIFYYCRNNKDQELVPSIFLNEFINLPEPQITVINHLNESPSLEKLQLSLITKVDQGVEAEKAYIDSLLQDYKLSVTHLNTFLECKRKFFYRNLLRVPAAKDKHSCFGTAVHAALFDLFTTLKFDSKSLAESELLLLESFEVHLVEQRLPEGEHEQALSFGKETLKAYLAENYGKFNLNCLLEHDFSGKGVNLDGLELTGKLDKIEIQENDSVVVIDYKTGNPGNKSDKLKPGGDYHRQIVFYQLLCDLARENGQFKFKMNSGEIDFVQKNSSDKFRREKIFVTLDDLKTLKGEIDFMKQEIFAHHFEKTDDLKLCLECDFKNICQR